MRFFIFLIVCVCVILWSYMNNILKISKIKGFDGDVVTKREIQSHPGINLLSEKERTNDCETSVVEEYDKERKRFNKHHTICRTHHQYMKERSLLIEVGGNEGADAAALQKLYKPTHIILEPTKYFADKLRERFRDNPRVTVLNFGLHTETKNFSVQVKGRHGEGTSVYSKKKGSTKIMVINSTKFFNDLGVGQIEVDLLSMDCEGCEFGVLENIFLTNMTRYFKNIQMEWHSGLKRIQNQVQRYCQIVEMLSRTHRPTFQFRYIYENWRRKDLP